MKIVIVGAGGHGRVVLDIFRNNHQFEIAGFLDSNPELLHQRIDGVEVLGDLSLLDGFAELGIGGAIVAIGDNRIRQVYAETIEKAGVSLINAIHPSATVTDTARVGKNVVIATGVNVCTHVTIADSVILNTGCIIDHESYIGPAAHICPGVRMAGHVKVETAAFIGIGATIVQNITVGEEAVVGAGAVVINDVPAYNTVVGVPARIVKTSRLSITSMEKTANSTDWDLNRTIPARPKRIRPKLTIQPVLHR
jgi:sugar O-acyltransferase (sialic acid O-acetyltransferase NeuD family)